MTERDISVRVRPGEPSEAIASMPALGKWLKQNPGGEVVYDSAGILDGRTLLLVDDHTLSVDKNYGSCSCRFWSMAGTQTELATGHATHVRQADKNGAVSCIFCGRVDTAYRLASNHGAAMGYINGDGICMAMHLTRNHVLFEAKQTHAHRVEFLPERIEIARELWARKGDAWLDPFEDLCHPIPAPEPQGANESEELALW